MVSIGEEGRSQARKTSTIQTDSRRNREETAVRIRKARKEQQMMKRRQTAKPGVNEDGLTTTGSFDLVSSNSTFPPELVQIFHQLKVNPSTVSMDQRLEATKQLRRLMSLENPPVEDAISCGAVPFLVELLQEKEYPDHIFEAAWALTNIASTKYANVVAESGSVPIIVHLLLHDSPVIREQAAWCLGNIAGDSTGHRDGLLNMPGVATGMSVNLGNPQNESLLSIVSWAVANLSRGIPQPPLDSIRVFIAPLVIVLKNCEKFQLSAEARVDAVWALSYISDGCADNIQAVLDQGMLPVLIDLIKNHSKNRSLMIPVVRAIGNCSSGTDEQTEAVLAAGFLEHALSLLGHESKHIRKDTNWILSNIAACTPQQINQLFDAVSGHGLVKKLVYNADHTSWDVRKEAIHAICNIVANGSNKHLEILVDYGIIETFTRQFANWDDIKLLLVILEATDGLLSFSKQNGRQYTVDFEESGGLGLLEDLQNHPNNAVYEMAVQIIVKYYSIEDDEDQNIAPAANDEEFSFGLPSKKLFASPSGCPSPPVNLYFGGTSLINIEEV